MFDPQSRQNNRAARVAMALFRITQGIKKMTQMEGDAVGLSPVQAQALLFIYHTRSDMATMGNLADSISTTHVTAVKLINSLIDKGLVVKNKNQEDRRITSLLLTDKGKQVVRNLDRWAGRLENALESLSANVLANLEIGLGGVVDSLKKEGYLVVAEPCRGCVHFRPDTGTPEAPHFCAMIQKFLTHEATLKECPEHSPASGE
ncbi:MarR family winged helix-turn-helix transcriptional regulator [Paenibacillus hamazuiensis]|uniref:MarR family winged helix-turn-helix transcriptional regulator n=1 Tax=Paenibacillus hamazuiensis TaxID=2936508 RepID=UPI00200E6CBA